MTLNLPLLERWQTGWSLARGLPLPVHLAGGLLVNVGLPDQIRRHVFADAGQALQECAASIQTPFIHLKAAVHADQMRLALPARWMIDKPGYLMYRRTAVATPIRLPDGFTHTVEAENAASLVRIVAPDGEEAAVGRVVMHEGCAVFDRIETREAHQRKGLGTALMSALDAIAQRGGASERLLVATEQGRALYTRLGWLDLAPWSTAMLSAAWRP